MGRGNGGSKTHPHSRTMTSLLSHSAAMIIPSFGTIGHIFCLVKIGIVKEMQLQGQVGSFDQILLSLLTAADISKPIPEIRSTAL